MAGDGRGPAEAAEGDFREAYERLYGHRDSNPPSVEIAAVRIVEGLGLFPRFELRADPSRGGRPHPVASQRPVYFDGGAGGSRPASTAASI